MEDGSGVLWPRGRKPELLADAGRDIGSGIETEMGSGTKTGTGNGMETGTGTETGKVTGTVEGCACSAM